MRKKVFKHVIAFFLIFTLWECGPKGITTSSGESKPMENAYLHMNRVMDKFHQAFDIYSDQDAAGNHGFPTGWMGDTRGLKMDTAWQEGCYSGNTCIKVTWITPVDQPWVGVIWQSVERNWGNIKSNGYDLAGATELTFWARGEQGGEPVNFIAGGITGDYPGSIQPKLETGIIRLGKEWKKYTIPLAGKDLSNVKGMFGWVTAIDPIFYIDEVKYNRPGLDKLRLPVSFETLPELNPDRYISNASYIYDVDIAMTAYMARGNEDDMRRTKILADTLLYALNNDRHYSDCRLRNGYMAGDIADNVTGKARLPGWWDPDKKKWFEDEYNVSTYTGNMAWTIIALAEYYRLKGGEEYKNAASCLGEWIYSNTYDTRGYGGYTGGYHGWEPDPVKLLWKSTEHNIDVFAAFMRLYEITENGAWKEKAIHAKKFVSGMWDYNGGFFWTGTLDDGVTINKSNVPVDVQAWGLMAIGNKKKYGAAIDWAEENGHLDSDGFGCFDFNNDKDGCWFEGTAHMAITYQTVDEINKSDNMIKTLRNAQMKALNNNGQGIVAASHDGVTTGFDWLYFSRLHIGATAWYIMAEERYNPYWGIKSSDNIPYQDQGQNNIPVVADAESQGGKM